MQSSAKKRLFVFDYIILIAVIFLIAVGVIAIFSTGYDFNAGVNSTRYIKQIIFGVIGFASMIILVFLNYTQIAEHSRLIFALSLAALVVVLIPGIGKQVHGSRSWLFFFQPSEFVKISTIIILADFLDKTGSEIKTLKKFFTALFIAGIPMGLILLQPDFGTFLVYVPITLTMLFVAGARLRYLIGLIVIGVLGLVIPMFLEYSKMINNMDTILFMFFSDKLHILYLAWFFFFVAAVLFLINLYMKNKKINLVSYIFFILFLSMLAALLFDIVLKDYQRLRLLVFLNPQMYRLDEGYNIIQALIAIGSGGLTGKGFLQGSQTQLDFIPQQVNDFIFSNIGEEWGFIGGGLTLLAFAVISIRVARVAYSAKDRLGVLIVSGVIAMIVFHVLVNVGMVIGIMPITGIPLPFISSGGSSLIASCIAIGLVFSVDAHRYVHRDY